MLPTLLRLPLYHNDVSLVVFVLNFLHQLRFLVPWVELISFPPRGPHEIGVDQTRHANTNGKDSPFVGRCKVEVWEERNVFKDEGGR